MASEDKIRAAGLMHVLPDERERENLISSLSSRERGYSNFSMRDRLSSGAGYMERGFSRSGRSDFDFGGRGGYSSDRRNDRRNDRRRDYR